MRMIHTVSCSTRSLFLIRRRRRTATSMAMAMRTAMPSISMWTASSWSLVPSPKWMSWTIGRGLNLFNGNNDRIRCSIQRLGGFPRFTIDRIAGGHRRRLISTSFSTDRLSFRYIRFIGSDRFGSGRDCGSERFSALYHIECPVISSFPHIVPKHLSL